MELEKCNLLDCREGAHPLSGHCSFTLMDLVLNHCFSKGLLRLPKKLVSIRAPVLCGGELLCPEGFFTGDFPTGFCNISELFWGQGLKMDILFPVSTAEASVTAIFVIPVAVFVDRKILAFLEQMEKMSYPES